MHNHNYQLSIIDYQLQSMSYELSTEILLYYQDLLKSYNGYFICLDPFICFMKEFIRKVLFANRTSILLCIWAVCFTIICSILISPHLLILLPPWFGLGIGAYNSTRRKNTKNTKPHKYCARRLLPLEYKWQSQYL